MMVLLRRIRCEDVPHPQLTQQGLLYVTSILPEPADL